MSSQELQNKYNELTKQLELKKVEKTRAETRVETLEKQSNTALETIKKLASVDTIEAAEAKVKELEDKAQKILEEAEALLDDTE